MGITKKSFVSLFLSFCLVFSLVSALLVKPVDAKTVRVAVIGALSGDVTIKKGGGSKSYDAYESMSLNQGDTVYTGASSSVTLNLSNGDADVILGENAEINVSDLNTSAGNKKSKLKVWAGSLWVKVKSLAGSNDEFEVETPTAVMGVRGTQFFVTVDPKTGAIKMAVGAGKVSASTVTNGADSTQKSSITYLYPTQQISLDSRDETDDVSLKVDFLDLNDFIKNASPEIIKEIILNKAEIDKENEEFIAKKKKEIEDGKLVDDKTSLSVKDQAELDKVKQNLDNLIGNIAKMALAENKVDKESLNKFIEQANAKIDKQEKKLDLNKVKELDKTAGVDAEKEKIKKEMLQKLEAEKLKKQLEETKKQEELKIKLAAALKALEEQKKKILEAAKAAEEKAKAEAEAKLKESYTDKEKKDFDDKKNGPNTTAPGGNPGNSGGADPGTPVLTPSISLAPGSDSNLGLFNLDVNLSDFVGNNSIYGVEVHLSYDSNIALNVNELHPWVSNSDIFSQTNSADHIKEYSNGVQKELVYAVTNFGANSNNVEVKNGTKKLVTIPFYGNSVGATSGSYKIKVEKIVIVHKNGLDVQKIEVPLIPDRTEKTVILPPKNKN
ncbi:FecR family protein [Paenibacillus alginolyticus]|uniref:FecR domain-containing protein n=1 Tax=Paenibacillus alginolyticus TaxID=59839 RepID=A0ABT4GBG0_9BACL|nr:FecR domain-containing protein [Paenibacillus alginolyticus]MCY9693499.1 FecR domain-containing protein [Paenibacillus alginolyticus]MEC0144468.1 FecR domain-containing protein [Paenibacillus alginolyticus]